MPDYDVAVVGGGPGGYVAAIRAAQLGLKTVVIEKDALGGLCLNWGCIPSKALLHAADLANDARGAAAYGVSFDNLRLDLGTAVDRSREVVATFVAGVETLLRQNRIDVVRGAARLTPDRKLVVEPGETVIEAKDVILATGASTRTLPNLPVDGDRILTSREALALRELPASVIVVGGGAIGCEFAYLYRSFGAEVTVVELLDHLLPLEDEDVSRQLERSFAAAGIDVRTATRVESAVADATGVSVMVATGDTTEELRAERVLVGVGVMPNTAGLGLEEAGVALERGYIAIDDHARTSVPGVWAAGDVTGRLPLAHVAAQQGVTAVETIAALDPPPLDYETMPRAVYCRPQVASLGLTEAQARERGIDVRAARFPLRANGKAMAIGETDGFVKLVAERDSGRILGYHLIGGDATELLGEASLALTLDATAADVIRAVHAHPTLSEALKEAALALSGEAVHFYSRPRDR